jgi:putative Holliday junction resolvase
LASPLQNVARQTENTDTVELIRNVIQGEDIIEIYVGLPVSMSGQASASTQDAVSLAHDIEQAISLPVRMIDERLTTVSASAALRSSGKNSKDGRKVIDQIAATLILEQALAIEKNTGGIPGTLLAELDV